MASFAYNEFKRALAAGEIDWDTDDFRVLLVMSNTTADTEDDVNNVGAFSTLDECDDTGYVRKALANEAIVEDAANDQAECDADDLSGGSAYSFNNDGPAGRDITGLVVYRIGVPGTPEDDDQNMPCIFHDLSGDPIVATGTVTITWNAEGVWKVT